MSGGSGVAENRNKLDSIADMSDEDIAMNAEWIRKAAKEASGLLGHKTALFSQVRESIKSCERKNAKLTKEIEQLKTENKQLLAIVQAVDEFDNFLNPTYTALIDWLESVSPYEEVIRRIEEARKNADSTVLP